MKILFLVLSFVSLSALAQHAQINCATTNITQSYTTASPGLPISISPGLNHFAVLNPSGVRICVDTGQFAAVAPASGGPNEHCVAAGIFFAWDFVTINSYVFVRADQANCTSTIIDIDVW